MGPDSAVIDALTSLFIEHRIVFWADERSEFSEEIGEVVLEGVTVLRVDRNEFGIKVRVLSGEPEGKFLIYRSGPAPSDLDNWLLDLETGYPRFAGDRVSIWLTRLKLDQSFRGMLEKHRDFFASQERLAALETLLTPTDSQRQILTRMLAICAGVKHEPRVGAVLESLLAELAAGKDDRIRLIRRCQLEDVLYQRTEELLGYKSSAPGPQDCVLWLFKACLATALGEESARSNSALVFLSRWKDNRHYEVEFRHFSAEAATVHGIRERFEKLDYRELVAHDIDFYELGEKKILHDLVQEVKAQSIGPGDVEQVIQRRRRSHWFGNYANEYAALRAAAALQESLERMNLVIESFDDGLQKYATSLYRIDQLYRQWVFHLEESPHRSLLGQLDDTIQARYLNHFLLKLNDNWQIHVDQVGEWRSAKLLRQDEFFAKLVQAEYLSKDVRICVVISDALRYEVGEELLRRILQEDRYVAELIPALSMLPSYTQLGMAALLPNQGIGLVEKNESVQVQIGGRPTMGLDGRCKILQEGTASRADAIRAETLLTMTKEECREYLKPLDVLFIYHNQIDQVGDKRDTETQTFRAAETAIAEIIKVLKKLAAANAVNMLVTADHGFLYQHREVPESDFASEAAEGDILFHNRRFVIGRTLRDSASLRTFSMNQLGLTGGLQVQIPKSINRLRQSGSGSRFVHGGASLQEVVIPILRVSKKRASDVRKVEVDLLPGKSSTITTNQWAVKLYQREPVTEKVQPRSLRAGLYSSDGQLISDSYELEFASESPETLHREQQLRLVLSRESDSIENPEVELRLEEQVGTTAQYQLYKKVPFTLRRSFTSDFDF